MSEAIAENQTALDVSSLPATEFDAHSALWWGNALLLAIETAMFGILIAIYFSVLMQTEEMRFSELAAAVPELSDRLLSERLKELESYELVERRVDPGPPVKVFYALTDKGRSLEPAVAELGSWARRWLGKDPAAPAPRDAARAG